MKDRGNFRAVMKSGDGNRHSPSNYSLSAGILTVHTFIQSTGVPAASLSFRLFVAELNSSELRLLSDISISGSLFTYALSAFPQTFLQILCSFHKITVYRFRIISQVIYLSTDRFWL
jgi:hypothetical protein